MNGQQDMTNRTWYVWGERRQQEHLEAVLLVEVALMDRGEGVGASLVLRRGLAGLELTAVERGPGRMGLATSLLPIRLFFTSRASSFLSLHTCVNTLTYLHDQRHGGLSSEDRLLCKSGCTVLSLHNIMQRWYKHTASRTTQAFDGG